MLIAREILGKSKFSHELREFINRVARYNEPVLLTGETGVGKEVVARNIHKLSQRKDFPFVPINCASIPQDLAEAEFFGYKKGAFTDAKEDRMGLIEAANRGTIFLDEITECSLYVQAKLLRVIEVPEIRRLGETMTRKVDACYIFATNKNPKEEIKKGNLREDLYFRINTLEFRIIPLRERMEDIPCFVDYFLKELNERYRSAKRVSPEAMAILMDYPFPGNVRELEKVIRRAFILAEEGEVGPEHLKLERLEEEQVPQKLFKEMTVQGKGFWEVVYMPFLKRDIKRSEVIEVIRIGLQQTGGSYKKLLPLFNMGETKKEYKKFMRILSLYRLKK